MLIGHWKLDGDAQDSSGSGYHGIEHGLLSWTQGIIDQCLSLDGTADTGIELLQHSNASIYQDNFTFSLWFKSNSTNNTVGARIASRDCSDYWCWYLYQDQPFPQDLRFYYSDTQSTLIEDVIYDGWNHITSTWNTNTGEVQFFVNGNLKFKTTNFAGFTTAAKPIVLGGNTEGDGDLTGNEVIGDIDDVRAYDHVLSKEEIIWLTGGRISEKQESEIGYTKTKPSMDDRGNIWTGVASPSNNVSLNNSTFNWNLPKGWWPLNGDVEDYSGNNQKGEKPVTYLSKQSSADLGWTGGSGYNNTQGETDPCSGLLTFEEALQYAYDQGARLPTLDELKNNATIGTGCGYDNELCWSCDKGENSDSHWVTGGDHSDGPYLGVEELRDNNQKAYVRMVADNDLNRTDPVQSNDTVIFDWLENAGERPDGIQISEGLNQPVYEFSGNYLDLLSSSYFEAFADTNQWSVSTWFKWTTSPTVYSVDGNASHVIIGQSGGVGGSATFNIYNGINSYNGTSDLYCNVSIRGNNTALSPTTVNDNEWHLVTVTWDGNTLRMYFDSIYQGNASIGTAAAQNRIMYLGTTAGASDLHRFEGSIMDTRVYDRMLSDEEIKILYNVKINNNMKIYKGSLYSKGVIKC